MEGERGGGRPEKQLGPVEETQTLISVIGSQCISIDDGTSDDEHLHAREEVELVPDLSKVG